MDSPTEHLDHLLYELFDFDPTTNQLGYSKGKRHLCPVSTLALEAAKVVFAVEGREVTAAEANMAPIFRRLAHFLQARRSSATPSSLRAERAVLSMLLRCAATDLDVGIDEPFGVGINLQNSALGFLDLISSDGPLHEDPRARLLLLAIADAIDAARLRDLLGQADRTGPVTVRRDGVGEVEL